MTRITTVIITRTICAVGLVFALAWSAAAFDLDRNLAQEEGDRQDVATNGDGSPIGLSIHFGGVLIDSLGCLLFHPFDYPTELYELERSAPFRPGDTVIVDGILDFDCPSSCSLAAGCVRLNVIMPFEYPDNRLQLLIQMMPGFDINPVVVVLGGEVMDTLAMPNTYLAEFPGKLLQTELIACLAEQEGVISVLPNYTLTIPESHQMSISFPDESMPIFIDHSSPVAFYSQPGSASTGIDSAQMISHTAPVVVAIIDNGIDASHPLLESSILNTGYDFLDNDNDPSEGSGPHKGHGTFVTGLVLLAASNCSILPIRAFDSVGHGTDFAVAEAIYYAIDQGADVINMSFGLHASSTAIAGAVAKANEAGIVMVASVGNEATTVSTYPAAYSPVIAVSSMDSLETAASYSNGGTYVDICAPGVNVYSSLAGEYEWGTASGTSFSAPLVAGACALLLSSNPDLTPAQVKATICGSARTRLATGTHSWPDPYLGNGCLDAFHAGLAWTRGDFDNSGNIDIADLIGLVQFMFQGANPPVLSLRAGDIDGNEDIDIADLIILASYMFQDGDSPWPSFDH